MADTHAIPLNGTAVGFYRGTQANLDALSTGTYKDGAFYITTDTDRLYYAQSKDELVYLNKSIQVVSSLDSVTNKMPGEFYYVESLHALAYWNGTGWVQVNYCADHRAGKIDISNATKTANNDGLSFNVSLEIHDEKGALKKTLTDTFSISAEDINDLIIHPTIPDLGDIQVTLNATVGTNKATVALGGKGAHASDTSFTIVGETGVTVAGSNDAIKIQGTTYSMGNGYTSSATTGEAAVILKDSKQSQVGKVSFTAGEDIVLTPSATNATNGAINIAHKDYGSATQLEGTGLSSGTLANGAQVTVVSGVDVSNGHVTGIRTSNFKLPSIPADNYATNVEANADGDIIITMKNGSKVTAEGVLYHYLNNEIVYNQGDLTEGVTAIAKDLVQNQLAKVTNAMTFKGGLTGTTTNYPTISSLLQGKTVSLGDTWIVTTGTILVTDSYDKTTTADAGDIIIASGTENADGIIASPEWIVIEGSEKDTTYALSAANNQINLKETGGAAAGNVALQGDGVVSLTSSNNTVTASHAKVTKADSSDGVTAEFGKTFNVISGVTYNDYGHVSGVKTTTVALPALPDQTNNHLLDADGSARQITLKNGAGSARGTITFNGDGTDIAAAVAVTNNAAGDASTVTFSHNAVTRTDAEENTSSAPASLTADTVFEVVTGVTSSATGHITGITTKHFMAQDTKFQLSGATVSASGNKATITDTLKTTKGVAAGTSSFSLAAAANGNLTVSASGTQVNLGLVWGTF